jgi:hypothetical protein
VREELEEKLLKQSCILQPFSEENLIQFLKQIWVLRDGFTVGDNKVTQKGKIRKKFIL